MDGKQDSARPSLQCFNDCLLSHLPGYTCGWTSSSSLCIASVACVVCEYGQELFVVGRRSTETTPRILYGETPMNLWNAFMKGFDGWVTRKVLRSADSSSLFCMPRLRTTEVVVAAFMNSTNNLMKPFLFVYKLHWNASINTFFFIFKCKFVKKKIYIHNTRVRTSSHHHHLFACFCYLCPLQGPDEVADNDQAATLSWWRNGFD